MIYFLVIAAIIVVGLCIASSRGLLSQFLGSASLGSNRAVKQLDSELDDQNNCPTWHFLPGNTFHHIDDSE